MFDLSLYFFVLAFLAVGIFLVHMHGKPLPPTPYVPGECPEWEREQVLRRAALDAQNVETKRKDTETSSSESRT